MKIKPFSKSTDFKKIESIISKAQACELILNKSSPSGSIGIEARKETGAFYTPFDAACLYWKSLLRTLNVKLEKQSLLSWLASVEIIDPSCGTGIFLYTLIYTALEYGVSISSFKKAAKCRMVDINPAAVTFVREGILHLGLSEKVADPLPPISVHCADGIDFLGQYKSSIRRPIVVGNPPYVRQNKKNAHLKNFDKGYPDLYAHFLSLGMQLAHKNKGAFGQIVPLSVTFSRNLLQIRKSFLEHKGKYHFINFDNIPDPLFSNGKPDHLANTANSQRISMVFGEYTDDKQSAFFSSRLLAWRAEDRHKVLQTPPDIFRVFPHGKNLLIPKPKDNTHFKRFRVLFKSEKYIESILNLNGRYAVHVSNTARNYISAGLEKYKDTGTTTLFFPEYEHAALIFSLLISNLFFEHWKMLGDGFHVTKGDILSFPLHDQWLDNKEKIIKKGITLWKKRNHYAKSKQNAGLMSYSFDFRSSEEIRSIDEMLRESLA